VLRPDDIERIHEARDILIRNLQDPPYLLDLAWQVGLNDTKLKRGFRQIFGTTVFGYLQLKRLERARSLLEERNMNVSEVAATVGYSSLSHFAKVFTQHFGAKPSFYLSELLNKAD
jgi:AraC-like DNA-binding protein